MAEQPDERVGIGTGGRGELTGVGATVPDQLRQPQGDRGTHRERGRQVDECGESGGAVLRGRTGHGVPFDEREGKSVRH